jgi:phytol kinase
MNDWIGLLISMTYLGVIILIASRLAHWPYEMSRTFAHIMVANWWLIASLVIQSYWAAMVAPLFFIVFNTMNAIFNWIPAINSKNRYKNLGTVYYAISVAILTHLTFMDPQLRIAGGLGILVMGYGDGLAAVIGQFFGKHTYSIFRGHKTFEGSLAMLVTVIAVSALYLQWQVGVIDWPVVLLIAAIATETEAISPYGLDNLFVPLLTALLYFITIFN